MRTALRFTGALLVAFTAALPAAWADTVTLRMGNEYPANSITAEGDAFFAEKVKELTGGAVVIETQFDAKLGKSADLFAAVGRGEVDLADPFAGSLDKADPLFLLSSLPFVAVTPAQSKALLDAARPEYERALAAHNQKLLYVTPWPPSGIWAKKPVDTADALKGLRIRTYDKTGEDVFARLGAVPASISFADAQAKLANGEMDAALTSGDGGAGRKLWDVLTNFTELNYAAPLSFATIGTAAWDKLTDDQRKGVLEAAAATEQRQWQVVQDRVAKNYEAMRGHGMTITTGLSESFVAALRAAAKPAVEAWTARTGERGGRILAEYEGRK
ncbi:TRAP transporter substrate-binding protein [Azospirillum rugosum]|uniref:TRAP-type C4-dicarboxylate transport system substrate-binding protein n=1 Tax=Azospirillum rugosum TaxID=416170 RepID=A0ABS4SGR0_9PROT|nr:TRAP transporter substrate-binding protein [Azospirillum rugosum]MBP2291752.1 TRAP-type C4-dicarboxylate transport system substrate-binding protein [Azospirillum rugosum]MDQ0524436.1 TRAP-type C4-dicarboxylate transport system substrate-binding protein [Azospirillum rugosum]